MLIRRFYCMWFYTDNWISHDDIAPNLYNPAEKGLQIVEHTTSFALPDLSALQPQHDNILWTLK